ncbi:hypothetical protein G6048_44675 [Streptomyces sp. YC419]|uniref:Uncharacterized protein n=1 Tax=Streptomyces ureilyticus TaxID=1775131 RepID=A0ABX0E3U2_9ACTN|nr:hypothetical protein [Streptomyces ureilyticus]
MPQDGDATRTAVEAMVAELGHVPAPAAGPLAGDRTDGAADGAPDAHEAHTRALAKP